MKRGLLSSYFSGAAVKYLSAVEADTARSHQHEINGVTQIREILGDIRTEYRARLMLLSDNEDEIVTSEGDVTWYDSRENQPHRAPEYRLYIRTGADAYEMASEGDLLLIALKQDGSLLITISPRESTIAHQLLWLFDLPSPTSADFAVKRVDEGSDVPVTLPVVSVLQYLGVEVQETIDNYLDPMLERFGASFPSTAIFSSYARESLKIMADDPDSAIVECMEREEILFRTFEKHLVWERVQNGFKDVDEFIVFSLSVQNRRKARAGLALENHTQWIFDEHSIRYSRDQVTEGQSRPDFLFPGVGYYQDASFPSERLSMLGVKSTCKDRWRQVLAEAARIPRKDLLTLEPRISENQTDEMMAHNLSLVVPSSIHTTYTSKQRPALLTLNDFLSLAKSNQIGL